MSKYSETIKVLTVLMWLIFGPFLLHLYFRYLGWVWGLE